MSCLVKDAVIHVKDLILFSPPNSNVKTLISGVTLFGERAFRLNQVKRVLTPKDWCPYKRKRNERVLSLSMATQKKGHVRTQWEERSDQISPLMAP